MRRLFASFVICADRVRSPVAVFGHQKIDSSNWRLITITKIRHRRRLVCVFNRPVQLGLLQHHSSWNHGFSNSNRFPRIHKSLVRTVCSASNTDHPQLTFGDLVICFQYVSASSTKSRHDIQGIACAVYLYDLLAELISANIYAIDDAALHWPFEDQTLSASRVFRVAALTIWNCHPLRCTIYDIRLELSPPVQDIPIW